MIIIVKIVIMYTTNWYSRVKYQMMKYFVQSAGKTNQKDSFQHPPFQLVPQPQVLVLAQAVVEHHLAFPEHKLTTVVV